MTGQGDDRSFLARSPNRGCVLDALVERPRDRADLAAVTGASQPTLGRIVEALVDRGWIAGEGGRYAATPLGEFVARAYADFERALATANELADVADRLPTADGFDPAWLAHCEVVRATPSNPLAVTRRAAEQVRRADHVRILTRQAAPNTVEALAARLGEQEVDGVVSPSVVEVMAGDPEMAAGVRNFLSTEGVSVAVAAGVPHVMAITDGRVGLGAPDEDGRPTVLLLSDDPAVVEWAGATFEAYRRRATPLDPVDLGDGVG